MERLLIIGLTGCAFTLALTMSASAMPAATPYTLGGADGGVIQVKGGHGHGWAITAVAAITTVGTASTTMVGGSSPLVVIFVSSQTERERLHQLGDLFFIVNRFMTPIKDVPSSVATANKPDIASTDPKHNGLGQCTSAPGRRERFAQTRSARR
jgi:hypothetical protein